MNINIHIPTNTSKDIKTKNQKKIHKNNIEMTVMKLLAFLWWCFCCCLLSFFNWESVRLHSRENQWTFYSWLLNYTWARMPFKDSKYQKEPTGLSLNTYTPLFSTLWTYSRPPWSAAFLRIQGGRRAFRVTGLTAIEVEKRVEKWSWGQVETIQRNSVMP